MQHALFPGVFSFSLTGQNIRSATAKRNCRKTTLWAYYMQNIALSHTNHMWLSPPTTTMGTVTPWFIISPNDVQKTCSKWMLRKSWKLQVVDLNQTSRRLHKHLNMFETIITQEIPLKKCQPLLFLVLVKRTQDSILNGQNYDCRDITKLWNSLDVDCTIWAAVNDVTM